MACAKRHSRARWRKSSISRRMSCKITKSGGFRGEGWVMGGGGARDELSLAFVFDS